MDAIIQPSDLALYLKDGTIDNDRAALLISDAQTMCANYLGLPEGDPFPANCAFVVARIALDAYTSIVQARSKGLAVAGAPFGTTRAPSAFRGIRMTAEDEKDLQRARGQRGAGSINLLANWVGADLPAWDVNGDVTVATS